MACLRPTRCRSPPELTTCARTCPSSSTGLQKQKDPAASGSSSKTRKPQHGHLRDNDASNTIPNQDESETARAADLGWPEKGSRAQSQRAVAAGVAQEAAPPRKALSGACGASDSRRRPTLATAA